MNLGDAGGVGGAGGEGLREEAGAFGEAGPGVGELRVEGEDGLAVIAVGDGAASRVRQERPVALERQGGGEGVADRARVVAVDEREDAAEVVLFEDEAAGPKSERECVRDLTITMAFWFAVKFGARASDREKRLHEYLASVARDGCSAVE